MHMHVRILPVLAAAGEHEEEIGRHRLLDVGHAVGICRLLNTVCEPVSSARLTDEVAAHLVAIAPEPVTADQQETVPDALNRRSVFDDLRRRITSVLLGLCTERTPTTLSVRQAVALTNIPASSKVRVNQKSGTLSDSFSTSALPEFQYPSMRRLCTRNEYAD